MNEPDGGDDGCNVVCLRGRWGGRLGHNGNDHDDDDEHRYTMVFVPSKTRWGHRFFVSVRNLVVLPGDKMMMMI